MNTAPQLSPERIASFLDFSTRDGSYSDFHTLLQLWSL